MTDKCEKMTKLQIPEWASLIYFTNKNKVPLRDILYGQHKDEQGVIALMKWQQLANDFDDETIQCMQGQIVAEMLGLA